MAVLQTDLPGQEDQLLGAVAVVVLVDDDLDAHALQVAETEVGDFHRLELAPRDGDTGPAQQDGRRGFGLFDIVDFHGGSLCDYKPLGPS